MTSAPSGEDSFLSNSLHVLALYSIAVAQPIYDVLGRGAEFFVAHRLGAGSLILFVTALSFGVPGILILVEGAFGRINRTAQRVLHRSLVFVLFVLVVAPIANRVPSLPSALAAGIAIASGAGLALAYVRSGGFRRFASILSLGAVVFPAMLLGFSPASSLIAPTGHAVEDAKETSKVKNPVPIVFVIFDEFEAGALLDETREIDPVRFPNFAALARESWWFPRATAVWTETQRAVPAILTGLRPTSAGPPTYRTHPNNLFSWLQGAYRLNVSEPLTSLCPKEACRTPESARFRPGVFTSDLAVLYLHMILPPAIASDLLPSMEDRWAGFSGAGGPRRSGERTFREAASDAVDGRRDQFQSFVNGIEGGNTLNFLHILLPHIPHVYLPDGSAYPGQGTEGLLEKRWVADPYFANLAYHRYLLQVGLVDGLVGKLVARLKASGLYDSALIVITADHGRSYVPGQRLRAAAPPASSQAASQVLQVPLFVKLPGQKRGHRSERFVHTTDILPTVADVLQSSLPWRSDGLSMIRADFPKRDVLEIPPLRKNGSSPRFALDALTSYPNLSSKLETFGSRTPLDRIAIRTPYSAYVGTPVADLPLESSASGLEADIENFGLFQNIDLSSRTLPALLRGEIKGQVPGGGPLNLAIALNGKVEAVTRTADWSGTPSYFAVMLPQAAFRNGRNTLQIFTINSRTEKETVSAVAMPTPSTFRLVRRGGQDILVPDGGEAIPVDQDAVQGRIEMATRQPGLLVLSGWAIDREPSPTPAAKVFLFAGGQQILETRIGIRRDDLVDAFKAEGVRQAGFALPVSLQIARGGAELRAFAVTDDGQAGELDLAAEAQEALRDAGS